VQRKRRTREHVLADLSVNHVERLIYRCGWATQRVVADYGIDLLMETFSPEGELDNGIVWFQLKATDSLKPLARRPVIPVIMDWRDVLFWLNEDEPGILVIYDGAEDRAWWVLLQTVLRDRANQLTRGMATITVHVPLLNRLDETAIRYFAELGRDHAEHVP